jgi:PKD repeat protein
MSQEGVDLLKEGLKVYVAEMSMPDHGDVITFGGKAKLMNPLTEDYDLLKADIVSIPGPGGGTYMVSALDKAIKEINTNGHWNHTRVIILHTDGQPTDGKPEDVLDMAQIAAANDIMIYTIGLKPAPGFKPLNHTLLNETANITGGKYYYAPKAQFLANIYKEIAQLVEKPGESPMEDTDTLQVTVKNLEPDIKAISASSADIGVPINFSATVTDYGSDDLYFVWNWDDGTSDSTSTYYNNDVSPDPFPSPSINPRNVTNWAVHTYASPGNYVVTLTIYDDDNGTCQNSLNIIILDTSLIADFTWAPQPQDEGYPVQFTDLSTFNIGSNVSYQWDFAGQGTSNAQNPQFKFMDDGIYPVTLTLILHTGNTDSVTYNVTILDLAPTAEFVWSPNPQNENSPVIFADLSISYPDDIVSWMWDFGDGHTSSKKNSSHIYGDDGIFPVTLTVIDDDNSTGSVTYNITVHNVDPIVTIESVIMDVEIGLRVAGRKYNKVTMSLSEENISYAYAEIERIPGSPDEQVVWIPKVLDMTKTYSAHLTYIPVDPPEIGANPVWVLVKFKNGTIHKIHHNFNVQQSKVRDSDHWNHIEPWDVDLSAHLVGWAFEVHYHVTDVGSDDEILTFSYGTQNVVVVHANSPPGLDPYPSPEINPVDIFDFAELIYEGPGTLTLSVQDDDNIRMGIGEDSDSIDIG